MIIVLSVVSNSLYAFRQLWLKWVYTKALLTRTVTVFAYFPRAPSIFHPATFEILPVDLKVPALQTCRNFGELSRHLRASSKSQIEAIPLWFFSIKEMLLTAKIWSPSKICPVASEAPFGCRNEMKIPEIFELSSEIF